MAIVTVGIELAKQVFAVHGVNESGKAELVWPEVPSTNMRLVPVKSIEQQSRLFVHRTCRGYVEQRTALPQTEACRQTSVRATG